MLDFKVRFKVKVRVRVRVYGKRIVTIILMEVFEGDREGGTQPY